VLVTDSCQGRGIGTQLLRHVVDVARAEGYRRIGGEILRDNLPVQAIFRKMGFRLTPTEDPASVTASLDLDQVK